MQLEDLKRSHERLADTVASLYDPALRWLAWLPCPAWIVDFQADGPSRYVWVNPAYERKYRVRHEDIRGLPLAAVWGEEVAELFETGNDAAAVHGQARVEEAAPTESDPDHVGVYLKFKVPHISGFHVGGLEIE